MKSTIFHQILEAARNSEHGVSVEFTEDEVVTQEFVDRLEALASSRFIPIKCKANPPNQLFVQAGWNSLDS